MAIAGKFYESDYEEAFCQVMQEAGWDYTFGGALHRKYTDTLLEDDLRSYLANAYFSKGITDADLITIIARMRNVGSSTEYKSLREAFRLYQDGFDFNPNDSTRTPFHIDYIDFDNPENNIYRVVNQLEVHQGNEIRIPDVVLYINGIPVCIVELKNPTDENATIREAHTQITVRYKRDIPSLLKYTALAVISDGSNSRLGSVFTPYEFFYAWKKIENKSEAQMGVEQMVTLIYGALAPKRITAIIRDYVYFPDLDDKEDDETEIVCRYPQFFAAEQMRDNIIAHLRSRGGDGKGGTYFGATGCGKTYTMLFLARQLALRSKAYLESPTILIIVDREDLETQAGKLFCKSKEYMNDNSIRVFDTIEDLRKEMSLRTRGGVYVTTIQKFQSTLGLLNDRSNIICFSDEAHRTQVSLGSGLKVVDKAEDQTKLGAFVTHGFATYLRTALPNATYVGFTGTPIDETIHVFGAEVDRYTMRQSVDDGITVDIKYEARLARVLVDSEQAKQIEAYYEQCAEEGATEEDIRKSKEAMSSLNIILGDPERQNKLAVDIINHYDRFCEEQPELVQKAMIVCSDRKIAYGLYKLIAKYRPEWVEPRKAMNEEGLSAEELEKLEAVQFVNLIATRERNDEKEMYDALGDKDNRKHLAELFKDDKSNFRIAIVVDMWITGFDAPCLSVLYNDKPLQKHTLIQTISRVNRKYKTKEYGLIVDYIGIRKNMQEALKKYGGDDVVGGDDLPTVLETFHNELQILKDLMDKYDFTPFFNGSPLGKLQCLQHAAEFIQAQPAHKTEKSNKKAVSFQTIYKGHVRRMRAAYNICNPAGALTMDETAWAQCFMAINSYLKKITDTAHDVESMNRHVAVMLKEVLSCNGIETILATETEEEIFGESFMRELDDVKMPHTKFQLLAQMLRRAIKEYSKTNAIKGSEFAEKLQKTVDEYNKRDELVFVNDVTGDVVSAVSDEIQSKVESLTDELIALLKQMKSDKDEFKKLGISFEEKAFYDILVDTRNKHEFEYSDEKCIDLARKIKELIDSSAMYADWINNNNIRNSLKNELIKLLYYNGYPPKWSADIFEKVLAQVENYKKNN